MHENLDDDEDMEFGDLKSRDSSMAFNKKDRLSSKGKTKTPTMQDAFTTQETSATK